MYLSCLLLGGRNIALYLSLKSHTDLILILVAAICISVARRSPSGDQSPIMLDAKTRHAKGLCLLQRIDDLWQYVVTGKQIGRAVGPRSYRESTGKPRKEARSLWTDHSIFSLWYSGIAITMHAFKSSFSRAGCYRGKTDSEVKWPADITQWDSNHVWNSFQNPSPTLMPHLVSLNILPVLWGPVWFTTEF